MKEPDRKTFPVKLDFEIHKRMRHAAIDEGVSLQQWIEQAISEKLKKEKREANSKVPKEKVNHAR